MIRTFLFIVLFCGIINKVPAQKLYGDRTSYYVNAMGSWATGVYKQNLTQANVGTGTVGASAGVVYNLKKDVEFPLSMGAEFGINPMGRDGVDNPFGAGITANNSAYWLNGLVRYRPVYWASKVNPFIDLSAGPYLVSTSIMEQLNVDEYTRIDGKTTVVFNTTIGIGAGLKLPKIQDKQAYLDIGVYFRQTATNTVIERNSVQVTNTNQLIFRDQVTPFGSTQLRVGLTWFR